MKEQGISFGYPRYVSPWEANTALHYAARLTVQFQTRAKVSSRRPELNRIRLRIKLQTYLAQGGYEDLELRIEKLDKVSNSYLGRIITSYGFVEYRDTLATNDHRSNGNQKY